MGASSLPNRCTQIGEEPDFLCQNAGTSLLRYRGQVSWPFADGDRRGTHTDDVVSGDLNVRCTAATAGGGGISVTPTSGATRIGPAIGSEPLDPYGHFEVRLWRSPARDIPVGQAVSVRVEVENTIRNSPDPVTAATPGWASAGRLYQQFGTALTPRRYADAPAIWEKVAALGTWSEDFSFTYGEVGVSQLRYNGNVYAGCVPSLVEKRRGGRLLPTG